MSEHNPPVSVSGVMLRGDGDEIVVAVEFNGEWLDVIREHASNTSTMSHIVEPNGVRAAYSRMRDRA